MNQPNIDMRGLVMRALNEICNSSSGEAISQAQRVLMSARENEEYYKLIIEVLVNQETDEKLKLMAAIEIKNKLMEIIKNKLLDQNTKANNITPVITTLIKVFFTEKSKLVSGQLSLSISEAVKFCERSFLKELMTEIDNRLQQSTLECYRALQLLNQTLEKFSHPNFEELITMISEHFLRTIFLLWKEKVTTHFDEIKCGSVIDVVFDIIETSSNVLYYIICYGVKSTDITGVFVKEIFGFVFEVINAIIRIRKNTNEKLESLFLVLISIFQTCRSKHCFEFLEYLSPILNLSINTVLEGGLPKPCNLALINFIYEVIDCREYRTTHLAAYSTLRKNLNKDMLIENIRLINTYFKNPDFQRYLSVIVNSYLIYEEEELEVWETDSEMFYIENFNVHTNTARVLAQKTILSYSKTYPQETAALLLEMLKQRINITFEHADSEQSLVEKINMKHSALCAFGVSYTNIKTFCDAQQFSLAIWIQSILGNFNIRKYSFVFKLDFIQTIRVVVLSSDSYSLQEFDNQLVPTLFRLFSDTDITVQLAVEDILRTIIEDESNQSIFLPVLPSYFENYLKLYSKVKTTAAKIIVMKGVTDIIWKFKKHIRLCYKEILKNVCEIWDSAKEDENMIRLECTECLTILFQVFPEELQNLNAFVLRVLSVCTDTKNGCYLNERGFEFFNIYLSHSSQESDEIKRIFANSFEHFLIDKNLKTTYSIIENFVLLCKETFFNNFLIDTEKLMWEHLEKHRRTSYVPIIDCLSLLIRILKSDSFLKINPRILEKILYDIFVNLNFSSSANFEISYKSLNMFCILSFYNYKACNDFFTRTKSGLNYEFLKILIDTFERVPHTNIHRNFVLAMACYLETENLELITLVLEPLIFYSALTMKEEANSGKLNTGTKNTDASKLTSKDRHILLYENEEINFVPIKSFVTEKVNRCIMLNGKDRIDVILNKINKTYMNQFEMC